MTDSIVRLAIGSLTLGGATAGAAGAPQPSAVASGIAGSVSAPVYVVLAVVATIVLVWLAVRLRVVAPNYAGKHRA